MTVCSPAHVCVDPKDSASSRDRKHCYVFVLNIWLSCLFTHCLQRLVLQHWLWSLLLPREQPLGALEEGLVGGGELPPLPQAHNHGCGPYLAALYIPAKHLKQDTFLTGWREKFLAFFSRCPPRDWDGGKKPFISNAWNYSELSPALQALRRGKKEGGRDSGPLRDLLLLITCLRIVESGIRIPSQ